MKASFDVTYTKSDPTKPHHIHAASHDPLSPFNWAGDMWDPTNSGTFSMSYDDGSFSASGSFDSAGNFGEMGKERNGTFVREDDFENATGPNTATASASAMQASPQIASSGAGNSSAVSPEPAALEGKTARAGDAAMR